MILGRGIGATGVLVYFPLNMDLNQASANKNGGSDHSYLAWELPGLGEGVVERPPAARGSCSDLA